MKGHIIRVSLARVDTKEMRPLASTSALTVSTKDKPTGVHDWIWKLTVSDNPFRIMHRISSESLIAVERLF